jgi:hypothetical protein
MKTAKAIAWLSFFVAGDVLAADDLVNSQITFFGSSGTALGIEAPPVVAANDCLIITGQINNGGTAATFTRAGWTELVDFGNTFTAGGFAYLLYPAVGNEDGTTVTVTSSQSVDGHGQMFVVSPCGGLDDWEHKPSDDTGTTEAPTAATTTVNDELVVQVLHIRRAGTDASMPTAPSGTTNAPGDSPLGTNFRQITHVAEYDQASAGATSTNTWGNLVDGEPRNLYTFAFLAPSSGSGLLRRRRN